MCRLRSVQIALPLALLLPLTAHADTDTFALTGISPGFQYSLSFVLPSSFSSAAVDQYGDYTFSDVVVSYGGSSDTATVSFSDPKDFVLINNENFTPDFYTAYAPLYSLSGMTETFLASDTPYLTYSAGGSSGPTDFSDLTITSNQGPQTVTPEPASWLLLSTGGVGMMMLGRRRLWS